MARPDSVIPVVLALVLVSAAAAGSAGSADGRVYVAKLRGGDGVDASAATALEDAVLVAAKKARPDMTVIGRGDVAMLADLRAEQEAAGCDAESCAAEIADALGAPQIVTGKLSHVGSTWILSLTRLERGSLLVLARESVEKQGPSPEVLIGEIPKLVVAVFKDAGDANTEDGNDTERDRSNNENARGSRDGGVSGLAIGGGVGLGAGLVAMAGGAVLVAYSFQLYEEARLADARGDTAEVARKTELGEPMNLAGYVTLAVGGATAIIGGVALGLGLAE